MDDVMFTREPRLLDVAAQLKRSAHTALGLATNCAQYYQRTQGTTFRALEVTSRVATTGAESVVYDRLDATRRTVIARADGHGCGGRCVLVAIVTGRRRRR